MKKEKYEFRHFVLTVLFSISIFYFLPSLISAQTLAPDAPGNDVQWASAGKQGVGTSTTLESKVWFTLQGGAMTEVYYPNVTVANVHKLEFVVVDSKTHQVETEQDPLFKGIAVNGDFSKMPKVIGRLLQERWTEFNFSKTENDVNAPFFTQVIISKNLKWRILKSYITDPKSNTVMIRVRFHSLDKNQQLYVYYDPSLANSGMGDTAWNEGEALLSQDKDISSSLIASTPLTEINSGFYQTSDGLEQLRRDGHISTPYERAANGNVAQMAKVNIQNSDIPVDFALGFGKTPGEALQTAKGSLSKGFDKTLAEYTKGWSDYVKTLRKVDPKYQAQFNMAAMQLKAHEDKTNRGANIASLSVPWGGDKNANENTVGGYHLVWSRDLYQVATAYMALGDKAAADRALEFLFKVQQKPDGSFPQNSWLDGKPFWGSLQLDEVAFPLILAYQLGKTDKATYDNHIKKAADFIVKTGPTTPQERWEERSGYSPSTIAAEIAGLVCAAEIARKNGDEVSAKVYLATADEWEGNIERWTATTNGKYGDGNYYLRITQKGNPNAGDKIDLGNGAGLFDEREIVDAGFLELVRLGIKSPDDPLIIKSLKVVDQVIRVKTPNGDAFYRYNHDGYGEMSDGRRWNWDGKYTGQGRLWALLSGERGQYELAQCKTNNNSPKSQECVSAAKNRLDSMVKFANDGLMIPEQIWDMPETPKNIDRQFVPELKFGEGTGSATPLAWSMAQFIRLAVNLQDGRNLDTPDIVYNRYVLGKKETVATTIIGDDVRELPLNNKVKDALNLKSVETCRSEWSRNQLTAKEADLTKNITKNPTLWKCKNGNVLAVFAYRESAKKVEIAGDFNDWKPDANYEFKDVADQPQLARIYGNVKFATMEFKPSARVEYKLIIDDKWIIDPLNPNKIDNGVGGENSFLTMPDYKPTTWDKEPRLPVNTNELEIDSKIYGKRSIKVYEPFFKSDRPASLRFPVLYLQDGSDYLNRAKAIRIQQNLVDAGKVKPFIMVFLDPKERTKEYWANNDYAKFLAEEVVPAIDAKYSTIKSREGRAVMGASLGGITSFWVGLKYPEVFSRIGGQSSSFWIDDERVVKELAQLDPAKAKFRFYIDDGTLEGVDDSRRVDAMLREKGFAVTYTEGETGHNWTSWRDKLAGAFTALWQ